MRTYIAKVLGLALALPSGMSLGKLGPFVQMSGCIAENLPYSKVKTNKTIRQQFMVSALVIGVSSTFGAPIGGLLFAIEIGETNFTVQNLWKGFFVCTLSAIIFRIVEAKQSSSVFTVEGDFYFLGNSS